MCDTLKCKHAVWSEPYGRISCLQLPAAAPVSHNQYKKTTLQTCFISQYTWQCSWHMYSTIIISNTWHLQKVETHCAFVLKQISLSNHINNCFINLKAIHKIDDLYITMRKSLLNPSCWILNGIFRLQPLAVLGISRWILKANSIEPGQTAWVRRLAWLYTGGQGLSLLVN